MQNAVTNLALYTSTSINEAYSLSKSQALAFFDSKPFEDWKKQRENELKIQVAIHDRFNDVVKSIGILQKTIARKRF